MKFLLLLLFSWSALAGKNFLSYEGVYNNSTIYSTPMRILDYRTISLHLVYSGASLAGSCFMEVSNDNVNYIEVQGSEAITIATGGTDIINFNGIGATWFRAKCTSTNTNNVTMKIYSGGK